MDKHTLEDFVQKGLSQRKIADKLKCSQTNIKYWLKKHGLRTRLWRRNAFCRRCGQTDVSKLRKTTNGYCKYMCLECDNQRTIERFRETKRKAVAYKGGKCIRCGYDKCMAALDFHHRHPSQKSYSWNNLKKRKFESIKLELDKCDLVCKNCHSEIHYG